MGDMKERAKKGRPTDYSKELDDVAYKLCLLGATDAEIAGVIGVTEQTINNWKKQHPSFFESLKKGKDEADAKIAESLYHRAKGYSHEDEKIFNNNGEPIRVQTVKHYAPDTTAAIFWLKNRRPAEWRDKQVREHTGDSEITFKVEYPDGDDDGADAEAD